MGPMNWLAAVVAAVFAFAVGGLWYGPLFGRAKLEEVGPGGLAARSNPGRTLGITAALLLVSATMMAHLFARVGDATLADKPWKSCPCAICKELGIHVVLFRGAERNRRRGFHNLHVLRQRLDRIPAKGKGTK